MIDRHTDTSVMRCSDGNVAIVIIVYFDFFAFYLDSDKDRREALVTGPYTDVYRKTWNDKTNRVRLFITHSRSNSGPDPILSRWKIILLI